MRDFREDPATVAVWLIAEAPMKLQVNAYGGCGSVPPTVSKDGHQVEPVRAALARSTGPEPPGTPIAPSTEAAEPVVAPSTEPVEPVGAPLALSTDADPLNTPVAPSIDPAERRNARERFEAAIKEHQTALRGRAKELCRDKFDPEDVYSDAMERAFRAVGQIRDPSRMRAWLLRILTNTFIDHVRVQRRRPPHEEFADNISASELGESSPWEDISADDLRAAIADLPGDTQETYRMRVLEGLSCAEISRILRIPISTVGTRLYRARKQLRKQLLRAVTGKEPHKGRR
jgi:RNA polymerase sigma-70 factor (ECF subfamily)